MTALTGGWKCSHIFPLNTDPCFGSAALMLTRLRLLH